MKLNILICDDDECSLQINKDYIQELNEQFGIKAEMSSYSSFSNVMKEQIRRGNIHIAFLDIDLKKIDGITLAKYIQEFNSHVEIVFITGHGQFTSQAYQVEALGYIQKPVNKKKLERVYQKIVFMLQGMKRVQEKRIVSFKSGGKRINVKCSDIIFVEKVLKKVVIHTNYGLLEFYDSIGAVEELLGDKFLRINQGMIVNLEEILYIDKNNIFLKSGENFRIGRTYISKIKKIYVGVAIKNG